MPKIQTGKNASTGATSFNFTDYQGKPVNAAQYVQLYNLSNPTSPLSYRQLLQQMANEGDVNAKLALNYVGDDAKFGGAPAQYRSSLEALGATGTYNKKPFSPFALTDLEKRMLKLFGAPDPSTWGAK